MLRCLLRVFIITAAVFIYEMEVDLLYAEEDSTNSANFKKHDLSICAVFKNEAEYLEEWIEYHLLAGVDHFYLYNIGSTDRFRNILARYIETGFVTLSDWPDRMDSEDEEHAFMWVLGTLVPAYENAVKVRALKETKWLAFVDVDEFLVPPNACNLKELLDNYSEYPGVTLLSEHYDSSRNNAVFPKRKLIIETVEMIKPPAQNLQKTVSKTIFKPECCEGFSWPPYECIFKNGRTPVVIGKSELRINHYANRNAGLFFGRFREKLHVDSRNLSSMETTQLLELDYEIDDRECLIYRFVPHLLKKLGHDPGWLR